MSAPGPRVKQRDCPECGVQLNGAHMMTEGVWQEPKPGDLTVCVYCGTVLAYTGEGLRRTTKEDLNLSEEERAALDDAVSVVRRMALERKPPPRWPQ